jgi:hypothetical protein
VEGLCEYSKELLGSLNYCENLWLSGRFQSHEISYSDIYGEGQY